MPPPRLSPPLRRQPTSRSATSTGWLTLATVLACVTGATIAGGESPRVTTTVYVGRGFEVRDHDEPVKYVFHGDTRIARITGSLSNNARTQRLRLRTGWNLVSFAVTVANALDELARATTTSDAPAETAILSAYVWDPSTAGYTQLARDETVPAGTVLWIQAARDCVTSLTGEYPEPSSPVVPAGGGYVSGTGVEITPLILPPEAAIWTYDTLSGHWLAGFTGDLAPMGVLPPTLGPGAAIYVHTPHPAELAVPDPARRATYYHPDHLGSTSAVTDADGGLIFEAAYFPFGAPRHQLRPGAINTHYTFTQKERDPETGLHHFAARYLAALAGRFISVDPRLAQHRFENEASATEFFTNPQQLNHYGYTLNNPLRFIDPSGEQPVRPRQESRREPNPSSTATIEFAGVDNRGSGLLKDTRLPVNSVSFDPGTQPGGASATSRSGKSLESNLILTMPLGHSTPGLIEAASFGTHITEASIVFRSPDGGKQGGGREYMRIKLSDVIISSVSVKGPGDGPGVPAVTFALNAAKIEIQHVPPPSDPIPIPYPLISVIEWLMAAQ